MTKRTFLFSLLIVGLLSVSFAIHALGQGNGRDQVAATRDDSQEHSKIRELLDRGDVASLSDSELRIAVKTLATRVRHLEQKVRVLEDPQPRILPVQ